jgi:tRNA U34 2-thiouridine synthase MnmA/TrmU
MVKALLLLSGGLDSTLAGRILLEMGVDVEAVNFSSPFCRCTPKSFGCSAARAAAIALGVKVTTLWKGEDYLDVVKHPRHGRGCGMNPCLDCRIFTFRKACELLPEIGADFVVTGEVLGQRPMSQHREAMLLIERESGLDGLIVRPLSAQLLPPSLPERRGLIDRNRLLSLHGRSRREQMAMASGYGIHDYPCPAGGCLLTDLEFSARMRELFTVEPECDLDDVRLLSVGRHFRLPDGAKVVVGRNEADNQCLEQMAKSDDWLLIPGSGAPGPVVLLRRGTAVSTEAGTERLCLAAKLLVHFSKNGKNGTCMDVEARSACVNGSWGETVIFPAVTPSEPENTEVWRIHG